MKKIIELFILAILVSIPITIFNYCVENNIIISKNDIIQCNHKEDLKSKYLMKYIQVSEKIDRQPVITEETNTNNNAEILIYSAYELWDKLLNEVIVQLKNSLPEDKYNELVENHRDWAIDVELKAQEAGIYYQKCNTQSSVMSSFKIPFLKERVLHLIKTYL